MVRERESGGEGQVLPIGGFLGSLPAGPLVGRDAELERALRLVDVAQAGSGRLVMLVGEPGVGKTRLAQEITLTLRNRGFLIAAGSCYEARQATPFHPFVETMADLYALCPQDLRSEISKRFAYLATLLPNEELPASNGTGESQDRLFWSVTGFIQAVAERTPVALLLDDLHWADGSSLDLLQHIARHTRGHTVLILGTYRDVEVGRRHPLEATLRELARHELVDRIGVRRLTEEGTAQLVATALDRAEITPEFADLLYERTEGNPFFINQVMRALAERGDLYREDGLWSRKAIAELAVPESIRSVVGHRLARLEEETQEVLREASVLGQTFYFDDLLTLGERDEQDLESALESAMAAGLLREVDGDAFAFDHALTQQSLYGELTARRKRRLHLAAGEAMESLPAGKLKGREAALAWHFLEGDDAEKALRYTLAAGDAAEVVFAHADAEQQYRTALELAREVGDAGREAEADEKLGTLLRVTGRLDEALEVLEDAAGLYRAAGTRDAEARAVAGIGRVYWGKTALRQGEERLQPLVDELADAPPSPGLASLLIEFNRIQLQLHEYTEALAAAQRAAEVADAAGDERLTVLAQDRAAIALLFLGRLDEGEAMLRQVIPRAEALGDLDTAISALNNLAAVPLERGDSQEGLALLQHAYTLADRLGDPSRLAQMGLSLASLADTQGRFDEALEVAKHTYDRLRRTGTILEAANALVALADIAANQGRWAEAEHHADEAIQLVGDDPGPAAAGVLAERGFVLVMQHRWAEAVAWLEGAPLHLAQQRDDRFSVHLLLTRACTALGQTERARALLQQTEELNPGDWFNTTLCRWVEGWVRAACGEYEHAARAFEEALALTPEDFLVLRSQYLFDYGCVLAQAGDVERARARLEEALMLFRQVGATGWVERGQAVLAELGSN